MHAEVTLARLAALLLLVLGAHPLQAQGADDWAARAIGSVVHYRASVLGDTTARFDGCSVARQLGDTARVPARIAEPARRMVDPCAPRERIAGGRYAVVVDSLARRGPEVMVYLTVVRGEWIHREDYALIPHETGAFMGVREARLWGTLQVYPRRPGRGTAPR